MRGWQRSKTVPKIWVISRGAIQPKLVLPSPWGREDAQALLCAHLCWGQMRCEELTPTCHILCNSAADCSVARQPAMDLPAGNVWGCVRLGTSPRDSLEQNSAKASPEGLYKCRSCHSARFLRINMVVNSTATNRECSAKPEEKIDGETKVLFRLLKEHYRQRGANSNIAGE